jgi:hypothetical protein
MCNSTGAKQKLMKEAGFTPTCHVSSSSHFSFVPLSISVNLFLFLLLLRCDLLWFVFLTVVPTCSAVIFRLPLPPHQRAHTRKKKKKQIIPPSLPQQSL